MKENRKVITICRFFSFLIVMAIISGNAYAAPKSPAGKTIFVHDDVWRIAADEVKKDLHKGDSVFETDTIVTGKNGSAQLMMSDGAYLAIRPNTSIRLDIYRYDKKKEEGVGESVITLLKGCFRSITGLIGKQNKEKYRIKTAVANIGIRGTDHEPLFIPEPEEGEVPIGKPGLYDKVNSGETYIETEAGVVDILPNQVGFVSDQNSIAIVEDTIPDVYEQFSVTDSEESVETSEVQAADTSVSADDVVETFSSPSTVQGQVATQQTPEMPFFTGDLITKSSGADYLSQVITGTQVYTFDSSTSPSPTNQAGSAGTLDNATLSVDFSRQAAVVTLQLTMNDNDIWRASATDIAIDRGTFTTDSPSLIVEQNGTVSPDAWGQLSGSLVGDGLNGAMIGYTLGDTSISETINGTATFYGTEQDLNTTYREIGIAGTDVRAPMPIAMALHSASSTSNISTDDSGYLNGFDAMLPKYSVTPSGDTQSPVHLDIGSATLTNDTGIDAESGITWGRWSGTIASTDRVTGTATSPAFSPQDLHFVAGPEMASPVALPIIGTRTYQFAGGTNPTDNLGNVGTLNSATLSADFTNMTVATGIDATVGAIRFNAVSEAAPIESGRYFNATHNDSLTIACTTTGTTNTGVISGAFYGTQGDGAGVVYSFNTTNGSDINTTISGAAGFK